MGDHENKEEGMLFLLTFVGENIQSKLTALG